MNKHVELVKKWLENEDSVSLEDLQANRKAAFDAYDAAFCDASEAAFAAYFAGYFAANAAADDAAYWIKQYEKLTK